jgi:hypothetical protein
MDADRFRELLNSYGGAESHWPPELRDEMLAVLEANSQAREWLLQAEALDHYLDAYVPKVPDLGDTILSRVARTRLEKLFDWLLPEQPAQWWRPALAGALPLAVGVVIGLSTLELPLSITLTSTDWEQTERMLLVPLDWYETEAF